MELSRRRVPLYGQAKVFALLEGYDSVPQDAEVYIVLEGSTLVHVTRAHTDVMLCFTVPGHNLAEVVSVQAYLSSGSTLVTWVGGASLEYVQDDAQDLAEHLVMHAHCLSSQDHEELSSLFTLGQEGARGAMDRRVALAVANLDIPRRWNVLGSHGGDERALGESPLHLAVRWGLFRLAELLLCQPGGLMAVSLPNQEGVTPLQLAQAAANAEILELLAHPPNPLATPPAGLSQVWADRSRLLRFCHDSGNLTLTVRQNLGWSSEESRHADILLLRERLRDQDFLREIKALRRERRDTVSGKDAPVEDARDNASYSDLNRAALQETDHEEPLMFGLNEEDGGEQEDDDPPLWDCGQTQSTRESQAASPTLAAAVRLSAMIHGKGRVYANAMLVDQVDDAEIKYRSPEEEEEEEGEEVSPVPRLGRPCWGSFSTTPPASGNHSQDRHPSSPRGGVKGMRGPEVHPSPPSTFTSSPSFPSSPLASAFRLFEGGQRRQPQPCLRVSPALNRRGCSLTEASQGLSTSLECDSGEEDILGHSYPCSSVKKQPVLRCSPRDERDSFHASPDFNRLHSPAAKSPEEAEVRLRSYSFSSPKAKPSRPLLNRDATITDQAEEQRAFTLTEATREKRIEDEDWDKYIIPSKVESEKYKVSRTFSFLKSRMSSTRNKAKVKGKEAKDGKEKAGAANGHQFVSAPPPGGALCVGCDRSVSGKELLQCSICFLNVHKSCRESVAACGKKPQERNALLLKSKTMSLPHNSVKDNSPSTFCSSASLPTTTRERRDTAGPLPKSFSISIDSRRLSDAAAPGGEGGVLTNGALADEGTPVTATPTSTELPTATQDGVDAPLMSGLSAEELGLEVESWSLAVSPEFCLQHDRHTIKRQEVIYELMQTELHHIQTLTVMSGVFRRGMLEELQLDWDCVARIFPCLDPLLLFHKNLFGALLERRQASAHTDTPGNYVIHQIGDILLQQFSDEYAEEMKQVYGEFCSHHTEAVNVFKELQQQNKKLQNFVKQQSNNTLVRRREVPEFILLVTQRITKYPVLLERILHYTREQSQEHYDLSRALAQIRDIIAAVDLTVNRHERGQELQEVLVRLENKSFAKLKNDKVFRKQDLHSQHRVLQYKGLVYWKTATGRLKDALALLLTDVLVFLQEKDQRFVFAAVDQKPPVIPLQKLIVREVANEERGMFLISASSVGPEMYEVHTSTRDERNAWMRHIRQAVESCPEEEEEEEERTAEIEESRRVAEVRVQKISKFQETLSGQDQLICNSLEEKLELYAELTELTLRSPGPAPHRPLLVPADPDGETPRQASALLTAALREAENLISVLQSQDGLIVNSAGSPVRGRECCGYDSRGSSVHESPSEPDYLSTLSISSASPGSDGELGGLDGALWSPAVELRKGDAKGTLLKVAESVQSLTRLLYSLQAAVTIQDSCYEVQKLLLLEGERPQLHLEQDKPRSVDKKKEEVEKRGLERKKEEVDEVQKLHVKLKQVQQRWDKECLARDKRQCEQESALQQREHRCLLEAERLRCEREELAAQLLEYEQSLQRLREGQRSVEREKEKIEAQQRLLQRWRHHRQSSLPMSIPLDGYKVSGHSRSGSLDGNLSVSQNEATMLASLRQSLPPTHRRCPPADDQQQHPLSAKNCAANLGLSASLYNSLNTLLSQAHGPRPPSGRVCTQQHLTNSDSSVPLDRRSPGPWRSEVTGHRLYEDGYSTSPSLTPLLSPHAYLSLEGENGEEGCEEHIVYL